jgi:hypothetical protein
MNRSWLLCIFSICLFLLGTLKAYELCFTQPFMKAEPAIKLSQFTEAKKSLSPEDRELLALWESVLTGRSGPLSRWTKQTYSTLGLKHVFTPSGFHLTAVMSPFLKFFKSQHFKLGLIFIIGFGLQFTPGLSALKRMILIKGAQHLTDQQIGFVLALLLDVLCGSFQHAPLSFSYSFLFLGIIYSGLSSFSMIFWFFLAQMLLAYFQMTEISPLLIIWSPLLNILFTLVLPILLVLSVPLCSWQIKTGIFLLKIIQTIITFAASTLKYLPLWEVHLGTLILVSLFLLRKWRPVLIMMLLFCNSLNLEKEKIPSSGTYEFVPRGNVVKSSDDSIYFEDGKCRMKLVRGLWFKMCSPKKRSTLKKIS